MTGTASITARVPSGVPRGPQANGNDTAVKEQRFSAVRCGDPPFAGFWRRLAAFLIDRAILYCIYLFILLTGLAGLSRSFALDSLELPLSTIMDLGLGFAASYYVALVLVNMAYFTYFHGTTGQTPGKMVLGIKVMKVGGGKMTPGIAFLRWVGYLISGAVFCLGFLWVLIDPRKQGWHDKIADTFVVRVEKETFDRIPVDRFGENATPA